MYWVNGLHVGQDTRLISVDLRNGRINNVKSPEIIWTWQVPGNLSWVAWEIDNRRVQIAGLPEAEPIFLIPALAEVAKSAQTTVTSTGRQLFSSYDLVASPDHNRLALSVRGGSVCEIWDIPTRRKLLRLENVHGEPRFSADGTLVGMYTSDDYQVVLWEIASGRRVGALPTEKTNSFFFLWCSDGRVMAGYTGSGVRDAVIKLWTPTNPGWDTELSYKVADWSRFFTNEIKFSVDGSLVAFPNGSMGKAGAAYTLWDIRAQPPRCIDDVVSVNGTSVTFDPRASRFMIGDRQTFHLFDNASQVVVPLSDGGPRGTHAWEGFSPDGRWMFVAEDGVNTTGASWQMNLRAWFRRHFGPNMRFQVAIYDALTGEIANRLPGDTICAWPADGQHVWVERIVSGAVGANDNYLTLELWPIDRTRPPWWLWLVTVCGVGLIFFDFRRQRLARNASRQLPAKSVV